MSPRSPYFDPQDYQLLAMISQTVAKNRKGLSRFLPKLSPNGIIELSEPIELRMASAVLRLLDTLEQGKSDERLWALAALRDEVLVMSRTFLRINTGRVLVQTMKELVRAKGDMESQLRLAHDFRQAATGRHSVVRRLLHRYHMLEMPEDWNQAVFDNHVHDANTKGRKNATHLIMDAWLKGIRSLTVIYYNYVSPAAAHELIRAAEIMGIDVRIGLLFHAPFRGRFVDLIWIPHGFTGAEDFISFLSKPGIARLMNEGRSATRWLERRILHILDIWNETERLRLEPLIGGKAEPLNGQEFMAFVGGGQASLLHLAEFIHKKIFPLMERRAASLRETLATPGLTEGRRIEAEASLDALDSFTTEAVLARLNDPNLCPESAHLQRACDSADCPEILHLTPLELLTRLDALRSGCRVTLNLAKLSPEDVLELLWDCQGRITHLELFNFKDWHNGDLEPIQQINDLQLAINDESVPRLKQIILTMLRDAVPTPHAKAEPSANEDAASPALALPATVRESPRIRKLRTILQNLPVLCGYYRNSKLRATMGTDSTSRPTSRYGMGLAYPETLPRRARRELDDPSRSAHLLLPLRTKLLERVTYSEEDHEEASPLISALRRLPGMKRLGQRRNTEWIAVSENSVVCNGGHCSIATGKDTARGSIVTLGGNDKTMSNGFHPSVTEELPLGEKLHYLNSPATNALRFLTGFLPALLAFLYTQAGALAWLGAPLWFLISIVRNIVQSVLGNGGWHRSSLLHWKRYVTWTTVYVSLMYNGLTAVLLEFVLRWKVLQEGLDWNIVTAPIATYTVLGLACGIFKLLTHAVQGFSPKSLYVDGLCTLISLPLILMLHFLFVKTAGLLGYDTTALIPFTVFVVKLASDIAVGMADGINDRERNLHLRMTDYRLRLSETLKLYSRLEVMFPEQNVLNMISHPADLLNKLEKLNPQLRLDIIINALDLMYFWFYQPRAIHALHRHLLRFSKSEKLVLLRMQEVLRLEKLVSQLLVHGLVGENFAGPLSFYIAHNQEYLHQMTAAVLGEHTAKIREH
ncbi:MAG: hypothetical protein IJB29_03795 [Mailhella sp.]|nr:hypothetical protein [Mailhella sp.]